MTLRSFIYFIFSLGIILFVALMASIVVEYFPYRHAILFLSTKSDITLSKLWYLVSFYIHITSSLFAIGLGIFQFMPSIFHSSNDIHKRIGYIYILSILLAAAPSGFLISMYANGGRFSILGFLTLSIIWWFSTWNAFRYAKHRNWLQHIRWMIRSYAITLAAFSLRTEGYVMNIFTHLPPIQVYIFLSWFAWFGNWMVAEIFLYFRIDKKVHDMFFQVKSN